MTPFVSFSLTSSRSTPRPSPPDTDIFDDLGADSLDVVELVMSIEEEYDIVITDERAGNVRTVAQVVEMLEDLIPAGKA